MIKETELKIGILGAGQMGEAIISGILRAKVAKPQDVSFMEPDPARCKYISDKYKIAECKNVKDVIKRADVLMVCVKPQQFSALAKSIPTGASNKTFISIMAGIPSSKISLALFGAGASKSLKSTVVRVMPNTPALVGSALTAIADPGNEASLAIAQKIFTSIGETVVVPEKHMDVMTALSGSGPAYFFYFVESLIQGGVRLGLSRELAEKAVLKTMEGSHKLLTTSKQHPQVLIDKVTSPGGTTIEAIAAFENGALRSTIFEALLAAAERAKELSE